MSRTASNPSPRKEARASVKANAKAQVEVDFHAQSHSRRQTPALSLSHTGPQSRAKAQPKAKIIEQPLEPITPRKRGRPSNKEKAAADRIVLAPVLPTLPAKRRGTGRLIALTSPPPSSRASLVKAATSAPAKRSKATSSAATPPIPPRTPSIDGRSKRSKRQKKDSDDEIVYQEGDISSDAFSDQGDEDDDYNYASEMELKVHVKKEAGVLQQPTKPRKTSRPVVVDIESDSDSTDLDSHSDSDSTDSGSDADRDEIKECMRSLTTLVNVHVKRTDRRMRKMEKAIKKLRAASAPPSCQISLDAVTDPARQSIRSKSLNAALAEPNAFPLVPLTNDEEPPAAWLASIGGSEKAARFKWAALAPRTRRSYTSGVKSYCDYMLRKHPDVPRLPARTELVEDWLASLADPDKGRRPLAQATLEKYRFGLRSWHTDHSLGFETVMTDSTRRIITGVRNTYSHRVEKTLALPITLPILRQIVQVVRDNRQEFGGRRDSKALVAAWLLLWAGWMRCGELTFDKFDPRKNPTRANYNARDAVLHVPWTKASRFAGVDFAFPRGVESRVCPIRALDEFIKLYPCDDKLHEPLLSFTSGKFTPKAVGQTYLDKAIKMVGLYSEGRGRGKQRYTGHSFRRGAASWAKSTGATPEQLRQTGRWTGQGWRAYVDTPKSDQRDFRANLYTAASTLPPSGLVDEHFVIPDFVDSEDECGSHGI